MPSTSNVSLMNALGLPKLHGIETSVVNSCAFLIARCPSSGTLCSLPTNRRVTAVATCELKRYAFAGVCASIPSNALEMVVHVETQSIMSCPSHGPVNPAYHTTQGLGQRLNIHTTACQAYPTQLGQMAHGQGLMLFSELHERRSRVLSLVSWPRDSGSAASD